MQFTSHNPVHAVMVMGVSGSGKSSVGARLAASSGVAYVEGDLLHPPANLAKMAKGTPLTDEDRWPWLDRIAAEISAALDRGEGVVVSCSALKRIYRDRLRAACVGRLWFVYLEGSEMVLHQRMGAREGHFMPLSLLQSQLATLEVPSGEIGVVTVDIDADLDTIVAEATAGLEVLAAG